MSASPQGPIALTMFSGGRGGASIARQLLRESGISLSLVINGYDNGQSTGALRRFLPGMLGPSDFRKNLLLHLDAGDPEQAALIWVLQHRLPSGATVEDLGRLADSLASSGGMFAALPERARATMALDLAALRHRLAEDPGRLGLADCALANLMIAGAYLRLGGDFNAAIRSYTHVFGSPVALVNVTNGENAFLVALKQDGRILADEAEIVAPQVGSRITDMYLISEPLTPDGLAELEKRSVAQARLSLVRRAAHVSLSPQARSAIEDTDLLVYGPGTPHSSLLPSFLTPGVADAVAASRARAKVFVVNIAEDHDVRGWTASDLVDRTLAYLGDALNERRTVTHVLCHWTMMPSDAADRGAETGVRWISADLEDRDRPGVHCGRRTVSALTAIAGKTTLASLR